MENKKQDRSLKGQNEMDDNMQSDDALEVKSTDMKQAMLEYACMAATEALAKAKAECDNPNAINNTAAKLIKKKFDERWEPIWHCIVGRSFGSFVVHETRTFAYFYVGNRAILIFKAGCKPL